MVGNRPVVDAAETRTAERAARNELTFREANDRIEATRQALRLAGPVPYICECELAGCTELLVLPPAAYSEIRARPRRFLIARGHSTRDGHVVEDRGSYVVIEKPGPSDQAAQEP